MLSDADRELISTSIRDIHDFPKPGIVFKDITTLLNNAKAFSTLIEHLGKKYSDQHIDFVAGIESRGFIFGSALARELGVGFVPVRKKGKLPYTTISEKYTLEYGVDEVEIHIDAFREKKGARVLLIDDLIATGGTAEASARLINQAGAKCIECCFIINLKFLKGDERVEKIAPVYSILDI